MNNKIKVYYREENNQTSYNSLKLDKIYKKIKSKKRR